MLLAISVDSDTEKNHNTGGTVNKPNNFCWLNVMEASMVSWFDK